jgi:hypothetical protein
MVLQTRPTPNSVGQRGPSSSTEPQSQDDIDSTLSSWVKSMPKPRNCGSAAHEAMAWSRRGAFQKICSHFEAHPEDPSLSYYVGVLQLLGCTALAGHNTCLLCQYCCLCLMLCFTFRAVHRNNVLVCVGVCVVLVLARRFARPGVPSRVAESARAC